MHEHQHSQQHIRFKINSAVMLRYEWLLHLWRQKCSITSHSGILYMPSQFVFWHMSKMQYTCAKHLIMIKKLNSVGAKMQEYFLHTLCSSFLKTVEGLWKQRGIYHHGSDNSFTTFVQYLEVKVEYANRFEDQTSVYGSNQGLISFQQQQLDVAFSKQNTVFSLCVVSKGSA